MRLSSKAARDYRWQTVIRMHLEGKKQHQIAQLLLISQSSVSRIIDYYKQNPNQVLQTKPALGASKRLSEQQLQQVKSWASKSPLEFGFEGQYWARARFQLLIKEKFGVSYQLRQVGNILKGLKITLQKPMVKDYRQKGEQVEEWEKERLPAIKKSRSSKHYISLSG